jgi:pyruvate dehydrogenase E1 component
MIPIYIFYSMFGFQRTGDGLWAAADQMARGFVLGATAGRTTLNGEGLQHQDGHSLLLASANPGCVAYDPAWAYEVGVIVEDGLRRMYGDGGEDIFYYLTVYNEPLVQPAMPEGLDTAALLKGMYRFAEGPPVEGRFDEHGQPVEGQRKVQLLASGVAVPWALKAQRLLADEWGVSADVWSVTSWGELRRDAIASEQAALLHPDQPQRTPYVTEALADAAGPVIAVSDWMRAVPDQIARWVPGDYTSLGTDGFGCSDTRHALRRFFHVDAESITVAALRELARRAEVPAEFFTEAVKKYQLDDVTAAPVGETGGAT